MMMMMMLMMMMVVMMMMVMMMMMTMMMMVVVVVVLFSQQINDTVIRGKNNTDVAGNGKEHQVQMIFSCLFLPLGFYGNAISLSWSERLRDRLHSALAEVWSEGTQCDQTTATMTWRRHCERSPMISMNLSGWFSKAQRFARTKTSDRLTYDASKKRT